MQDVYALAESRQLTEVTDISNESSKDGIRIVLELKKDADIDYVKNLLYKKTKLEDTFGVNMLAIADGKPETLGLVDILKRYSDYQIDLNTRKYTTLLKKEEEKREVQEGLIRAVDVIDLIIEILRGSKNQAMAKDCLINGVTDGIKFKSKESEKQAAELHFTERQTDAILSMRLYRLIGLEIEQLQADYEKCLKAIKEYTKILKSKKAMVNVIIKELEKIKKDFGYERRTLLEDAEAAVIPDKPVEISELVMLMDKFGYVKTIDKTIFEKNEETAISENKTVLHVLNTDKICLFTSKGNMHRINVADMPQKKLKEKGVPIDNLGNFKSSQEDIVYMCLSKELDEAAVMAEDSLLFVTKKAFVKRVCASEFIVSKRTIAATKLSDGDELLTVINLYEHKSALALTTDGSGQMSLDTGAEDQTVVLESKAKYKLRFPLSEIPAKKKTAVGVRGMKLGEGDVLKSAEVVKGKVKGTIGHRDSKGRK